MTLNFPKFYSLNFPKFYSLDELNDDKEIWRLNWDGFQELPDAALEARVQSLRFDYEPRYVAEIQRCMSQAQLEWDYPRSFDTCVREMCLKPAAAYTQVVFGLIWDLVKKTPDVDIIEDWWLQHALMYKMWMGQTGSGVVRYHADLPELENWVKDAKFFVREDQKRATEKFLKIIDNYETSLLQPKRRSRKKKKK